MAGDWMKVEHSTLDITTEIFVMAESQPRRRRLSLLGIRCAHAGAGWQLSTVDGRVDVRVTGGTSTS